MADFMINAHIDWVDRFIVDRVLHTVGNRDGVGGGGCN